MSTSTLSRRELVLASASPRRRELISLFGLPYRVLPPAEVDESIHDHEPADKAATRLARLKAHSTASRIDTGVVLGADTIVVCDGQLLGKPVDEEDALRMLRLLNGREHQVYTGVVLLEVSGGLVVREQSDVVCTRVWFRRVSEDHLRRYVATGEPLDKAGAYGAQGFGSTLIERIEGCYFNVVGLPVSRVCAMLESWGFVPLGTVAEKNL